MENEKEGWMVIGQGDVCIAIPASLAVQVIASMVTVSSDYNGRLTITNKIVPMSAVAADTMAVLRVKHKLLGKAEAESASKAETDMATATTAMEIKMKQMEMVKKLEHQKMKAQYDLGMAQAPDAPLTRRVIKQIAGEPYSQDDFLKDIKAKGEQW